MKTYQLVILALIAVASFVAEFGFLSGTSKGHWWNHVPAFYALWGFVGCIVIILASKWMGKLFIQKKEDYYDSK